MDNLYSKLELKNSERNCFKTALEKCLSNSENQPRRPKAEQTHLYSCLLK